MPTETWMVISEDGKYAGWVLHVHKQDSCYWIAKFSKDYDLKPIGQNHFLIDICNNTIESTLFNAKGTIVLRFEQILYIRIDGEEEIALENVVKQKGYYKNKN
jgi:hypothetical protein